MEPAQYKQNLAFENWWEKDIAPLEDQILMIWRDHGGPTGERARERLKEIVFVARDPGGRVVGLSTAFRVYVKQLRNYFFALRVLIVPEYRIPGLTSKLVVQTRDFLESVAANASAIGIITLVENPRLKKYRNEAIWPASGMVYIGNSGEGHHIRVYYFKGARIEP